MRGDKCHKVRGNGWKYPFHLKIYKSSVIEAQSTSTPFDEVHKFFFVEQLKIAWGALRKTVDFERWSHILVMKIASSLQLGIPNTFHLSTSSLIRPSYTIGPQFLKKCFDLKNSPKLSYSLYCHPPTSGLQARNNFK